MYAFVENLKMVPALISFNFYSQKFTFDPIKIRPIKLTDADKNKTQQDLL
jgi:hypothetical protein